MTRTIRLGTRGSVLALAQARGVAALLEAQGWSVALEVIRTTGDRTTGDRITERAFTVRDGVGVFVAEIERALLDGQIDLAVHSMKDLPTAIAEGLAIVAIPRREDPRDVLISRTACTWEALPPGAVVGTSSLRRKAQLLAARPDLAVVDIRGNIDTRLRKLDAGAYDAVCLAAAGLHRLGLQKRITQYFDRQMMVPAVGQGALALQTRAEDQRVIAALVPLHHEATARAVHAERAVLAALGGGCGVPLGALAMVDGPRLSMIAVLGSADGSRLVRETLAGEGDAETLGNRVAEALQQRITA